MESILIIDDEPQIRSMIRLVLERAGYSVAEAADGVEGIRRFRENPVNLIITDLIMPNKDGIGMIIELKKEFPDIKIIAMSGGGLNRPEGYLRGAQKLGAACTLPKPINRQELLRVVKDTLGSKPDASSNG
jgi:CheY-like chemotaxis protein